MQMAIITGKLAPHMANATGYPLTSVLWVIRVEREAGLVADSRSRPFTTLDAARVLIGLAGAEKAADAALAVRALGGLRNNGLGVWTGEPTDDTIAPPHRNHPFQVALSELIKQLRDLPPNVEPPQIRVVLNINELLCQIYIGGMRYEYVHESLRDKANQLTDDIAPFVEARKKYANSKIGIVHTINEDVLAAIAVMFRAENTEARDVESVA
jgi:hypothetical protein